MAPGNIAYLATCDGESNIIHVRKKKQKISPARDISTKRGHFSFLKLRGKEFRHSAARRSARGPRPSAVIFITPLVVTPRDRAPPAPPRRRADGPHFAPPRLPDLTFCSVNINNESRQVLIHCFRSVSVTMQQLKPNRCINTGTIHRDILRLYLRPQL
ncbi:hypothetical protein EVAR_27703_1 [Eumeta japonica]|uniref:Uncharacterized protein n=1 Tax=Eumeta variegata TaxID=151549 RepID=A0A4C1WPH7_EUMVA|nr:hypothetical protein EVAR_27703_1 [Eumeta japonica]